MVELGRILLRRWGVGGEDPPQVVGRRGQLLTSYSSSRALHGWGIYSSSRVGGVITPLVGQYLVRYLVNPQVGLVTSEVGPLNTPQVGQVDPSFESPRNRNRKKFVAPETFSNQNLLLLLWYIVLKRETVLQNENVL